MGKIKGIRVTLHVFTDTGEVDGFKKPILSDSTVTVDNVLVGEPSSEELVNTMTLTGKKLSYVLGIPKGDDHVWEDTVVEFFGEKFRTIGKPTQGIEDNIPLSWNKKVKVMRIEQG